MKVINNFLDRKIHKKIYDIVFGDNFPLFYHDTVAGKKDKSDYMFTHIFYHFDKINSDYHKDIIVPLLDKLTFTKLIRAKLNFYTKKPKHIQIINTLLLCTLLILITDIPCLKMAIV